MLQWKENPYHNNSENFINLIAEYEEFGSSNLDRYDDALERRTIAKWLWSCRTGGNYETI